MFKILYCYGICDESLSGQILFHRIIEAIEVEWKHHMAFIELQESVASSELGQASLAT
jgi:hypothetical protein